MVGRSCSAPRKSPSIVAAHIELDLAEQQEQPAVGLRAALHDGDVEPVSGVGAVGQRLTIAARLRVGEPVGADRGLAERAPATKRRSGRRGPPRRRYARG